MGGKRPGEYRTERPTAPAVDVNFTPTAVESEADKDQIIAGLRRALATAEADAAEAQEAVWALTDAAEQIGGAA